MSTVPWGPDLPQCFLRAGYTIQPQDNVLREQMDVGPPKARARSTVQNVEVKAAMRMDNEQRRSFLVYYNKVIRFGTIAFALDDPDGVTREYFMTGPPSLVPEGLGWRCDMQLRYTDLS